MSNVDLIIGGREFKVACAEGEEAHVTELGRLIDSKVANMNMTGQSEGRMLLFASLLLADELRDGRLVRPFKEHVVADFSLWFVTARSRGNDPKVSAFKAWVKRQLKE